jgi:hypothetical protein
MITLGVAVDIEPHEALLAVLRLSSGHVAWLREELAGVEDLGLPEAQILIRLYGEERDRVGRLAKACLDAGVAERQVQLAERYGAVLAELLRAVFDDPELALSGEQRQQLPRVLRQHLGRLEASRVAFGPDPAAGSAYPAMPNGR